MNGTTIHTGRSCAGATLDESAEVVAVINCAALTPGCGLSSFERSGDGRHRDRTGQLEPTRGT